MGGMSSEIAQRRSLKRMGEPIPLKPFLDWCDKREAQLRAELDAYPAINGGGTGANPPGINPHVRLMVELGWDDAAGHRRLSRWRLDSVTGMGSRELIERALDHAGVPIEDLYPDLAVEVGELRSGYCQPCKLDVLTTNDLCPWCDEPVLSKRPRNSHDRKGQGRKMTDEQIRAAHVIYQQQKLSYSDLAELLWQRFGYASKASCESGLRVGFKALGLPRRTKLEGSRHKNTTHGLCVGDGRPSEYYQMVTQRRRDKYGTCSYVKRDGSRCEYINEPGTDTCGYHNPDKLEQRRQVVMKARAQYWGFAA